MPSSITEQSFEEYVREKTAQYGTSNGDDWSEDTLWYAGGVLVRFLESDKLFDAEQETPTPVLANLFGKANAATTKPERVGWYRRLGDTTLFLGALFPDNFKRRGISKDYFVGMGGGAYHCVADQMPRQKQLFNDLAERFPKLMQILAEVCEQELLFDAGDIVQLYERWSETGNLTSQRQLSALGIIPIIPNETLN